MAFWLLLFDTNEEYSHKEFVKAQKQRLNGMLLSLDVYFAHNLDIHDEAAIKAFLPHLSQIQKMGHFNTLLDRIENTKGNNALELCTTARFLYKEDADFRSCFHKRQNTIKVYTIQNSLVYLTILVRLLLNKNTEGFRLLIENHDNLHYPQFIFHHKQFTILSTCILYSNNPIAADCIKLLLAQGVTISQPIEVYPENKLQHVVALSKARHSTQDITPINLTVTQLSSIIEDGLAFAIENRFENLDLIKLLAEHSSLERILINLAHLSLNELFNFRICNSQVAVFAVLTDVNQCNVVTNQIRAIKNVSSLACLFYHVDPNAEDIMHRFDIIDILAGPYKTKADQTSDQDIRDLTNKFIVQAKQAQSHPDELVISLKYVHAGLLAWLQIKDFNADDYKMALQLLYLRGMINSRVYRSNADELALMSYGTAINLIDYLPDSLSVELKQSKLYQLHCSATKLCSDRLKERHQSGLFTQTNGAQTANPTINMALQRK